MKSKKLKMDSKLIHAGHFEDQFLSATVPIYQTSTFAFSSADQGAACFAGEDDGYIYTRIGNPTISALENAVSELENGYKGIATSSGMGAVNVIYFALLNKGDHIVSTDAVYGPSRGVIESHYSRFGVEYSYLDTSDAELIEKAIKPNTRLLYIETPSNPTMTLTDIRLCADIAHKHGLLLVVDNTFCSPYLQNPLDLGADIVFHSITKYLNGHADVVGGIIVTRTKEVYDKLRPVMVTMGCNMDPHQAYLVIRGLKTLGIRLERAQANAQKIAEYLEKHPKVKWVKYPGLKSNPQYDLAVKQMRGFGAMISFELTGGLNAGKILMDNVGLATLAVSLGGVETLIQHPASMTHAKVSKNNRELSGITEGLVRYSVGIEDVDDLIEDLEQALAKI
jgi:methionine-gamma-lyase